ncbi:MAG: YceD family protein [Sulfobacillus sp.]
MMEIRVSDVKKWAGREETQHIEDEWPAQIQERVEFPVLGPLSIDVKVRNTGQSLVVECQGTAVLSAVCSRCLEPFMLEVPYQLVEEFREETGADDPELDYYRFNGDKIVLDELIADCLGVSIPIAPVCRSDCLGLCPQCGANLNLAPCDCRPQLDDRWGPLQKWQAYQKASVHDEE